MKIVRHKPDEVGYKSERLDVRLSPEEAKKLELIALKKGMKKSQVIHHWIEKEKV